MKRLISILCLIATLSSLLIGCKKSEDGLVSPSDAKNAIYAKHKDAIILECIYNPNANIYEIEFETTYASYVGYVNSKTGELKSVTLKVDFVELGATEFEKEPEEEAVKYIPLDTALSIAVVDSGISGTASLIKRELDRNQKIYNLIFRSNDIEYNYIIDAVTGDIIASENIPIT